MKLSAIIEKLKIVPTPNMLSYFEANIIDITPHWLELKVDNKIYLLIKNEQRAIEYIDVMTLKSLSSETFFFRHLNNHKIQYLNNVLSSLESATGNDSEFPEPTSLIDVQVALPEYLGIESPIKPDRIPDESSMNLFLQSYPDHTLDLYQGNGNFFLLHFDEDGIDTIIQFNLEDTEKNLGAEISLVLCEDSNANKDLVLFSLNQFFNDRSYKEPLTNVHYCSGILHMNTAISFSSNHIVTHVQRKHSLCALSLVLSMARKQELIDYYHITEPSGNAVTIMLCLADHDEMETFNWSNQLYIHCRKSIFEDNLMEDELSKSVFEMIAPFHTFSILESGTLTLNLPLDYDLFLSISNYIISDFDLKIDIESI